MSWEMVIGLETHVELSTRSKVFCACRTEFGAAPNTHVCPVCMGLPGALPVFNEAVLRRAAMAGYAMGCHVHHVSRFDRKNYFYPDLPKAYQISQFYRPICEGGLLTVQTSKGEKRIGITRIHIEEDAGKLVHDDVNGTMLDMNRCGVPLVEMVTEPDLRSGEEAAQYLTQLRQLLRWIGVSEADMERGHLRCDANVSIRERGSQILNTKTEIKNVNSIDAIRQAIIEETKRQIELVEAGGKVVSYTLDWDADTGRLSLMRSKETEADYRYFREPDLLPVVLTEEEIARIKAELPELPLERKARFETEYGLAAYDAEILTSERGLSDYFETAVASFGGEAKTVSNWMMNDLSRLMNDLGKTASELVLTPAYLAQIIGMVEEGKINAATGKSLLRKVEESGREPAEIVEVEGLAVIADSDALRKQIQAVLAAAPAEVESFRAGKESLMGWFVGQVMRATGGKADPKRTREILLELLRQ